MIASSASMVNIIPEVDMIEIYRRGILGCHGTFHGRTWNEKINRVIVPYITEIESKQ
jgi:hypothetical protein